MSIVEMVVAMATLLALLVPLLRFFDGAVTGAAATQRETQLHGEARLVVDRLVREARQAYTGTSALEPLVVNAAGDELTFYSPDHSTQFWLRRLEYRIEDGQLLRSQTRSDLAGGPPWSFTSTAGPAVAVLPVEGGSFAVVEVGARKQLQIELVLPTAEGRAPATYETTVQLRNVR